MDPQFMSNVLDVSALAPPLSYHQIVLSGQHPRSPSGQTCKTECRWSEGTSQIAEKGTLQGVANTSGFVKKRQKTPKQEIKRAERILAEFRDARTSNRIEWVKDKQKDE
jgi:hypothetical protein